MNKTQTHSRLRLLFAGYILFLVWLSAVVLWLCVPFFLTAAFLIYVPSFAAAPVRSAISLTAAVGIAIIVLGVTRLMIRCSHSEFRDARRRST